MKTKIIGILIVTLLITTVFPATGIVSVYNSNNRWIIFQEIDETQNKVLIADDVIGDIHVQYWEHVINDVFVKNDSILLQIDIEDGDILNYEKSWTDVDFALSGSLYGNFEPKDIFWKQLVIFPDEDDCSYFYTFCETQEYPMVCWEVRHTDGTTITYDLENNKIGQGIPAPSEKGFSLNGYDDDVGPNCWRSYRISANKWFKKWCDSTVSLASPSTNEISNNVQNPEVTCFFELAHGSCTRFRPNEDEYYYSSNVKNDMADRSPMKFAFIGSCGGMDITGPGKFSYEFRKGQMENTATVGYTGMGDCPGWSVSLSWQEYMFEKMDDDLTIKESFDLASAHYPTIAPCVKFVGDESITINYNSLSNPYPADDSINVDIDITLQWECEGSDEDNLYHIYLGKTSYLDEDDLLVSNLTEKYYHIDSLENNTHYYWKVVAEYKGDTNIKSDIWSFYTIDTEPPRINITNPQIGYLYTFGNQKRETLLGGTGIIGEILIQFSTTDNLAVDKIEFYIDNQLKYSDDDGVYYWNWDESKSVFGKYKLKAIAYDLTGNTNSHEIDVWKLF